MPTLLRTGLLLPLAIVAACSGGDKIVGADGSSSKTTSSLTSGDSTYLAAYVSAAAAGLIKQMRTITNVQATGFGSSRPSCTPSSVTGTADANSNGIPDDQTTTYAASSCSFLNGGATTTAAGSIRLQDLGGTYGYRVTYSNYTLVATKGDSTTTATVNGAYDFRFVTTTTGSAVDNTTLVIRTQSSAGSTTLTRAASITGTLTPITGVFAINSFPGATMTLSGSLSITFALTGNAVQANYPTNATFNIALTSPSALTSPISCSANPSFTAGTIDGTITGTWRSALRVSYTACGSGVSDNPGKR
jgi:hypothetical protein